MNLVECIYVANDAEGTKMIERGKLSDIAVTIVDLLGLKKPEAMTADNIIMK